MLSVIAKVAGSIASAGRGAGVIALSTVEALLDLVPSILHDDSKRTRKSDLLRDVAIVKEHMIRRIAADSEVAEVRVSKERAEALQCEAQARKTIAEAVLAENIVATEVLLHSELRSALQNPSDVSKDVRTVQAIARLRETIIVINSKCGSISIDQTKLRRALHIDTTAEAAERKARGAKRKRSKRSSRRP